MPALQLLTFDFSSLPFPLRSLKSAIQISQSEIDVAPATSTVRARTLFHYSTSKFVHARSLVSEKKKTERPALGRPQIGWRRHSASQVTVLTPATYRR